MSSLKTMPYTYDHPRPALSSDCVVFGLNDTHLDVLLVERKKPPFAGRWALPGGFIDEGETLEHAARRELDEETGLKVRHLAQLGAFDDPRRDPRGRVISIAFMAVVPRAAQKPQPGSDARRVGWFRASSPPRLAFDHRRILSTALEQVHERARKEPLAFDLLPKKFTLTQLQRVIEALTDRQLDKRNFRKKVLALGVLDDLGELEQGVSHRAARLYRFNHQRYREMLRNGESFEL